MSEIQDSVLAAIDGGARDIAAIEEATGFERNQIYGAVHHLKKSGVVLKGDDGLMCTAQAGIDKAKANGHDKDAPTAPAKGRSPPPERPKKKPKATRKPIKAGKGAKRELNSAALKSDPPAIEVARFGEYVVIKREDLAKLAQLFDAVMQWRDAIRTA